MKYLGYIIIVAAFVMGYLGFHPAIILAAAGLTTLIYASSRRKALKEQSQAPDQNMFFDGAFLLAGQVLIVFVVYILGWFFANLGTPSGMLGRTMGAFVVIGVLGIIFGILGRQMDKKK